MKKAYIKVKSRKKFSFLKRPYIAATIIGASLCAVVLSLTVSKPALPKTELKQMVPTETMPSKETELPKKTPTPKTETDIPKKTEIEVPKPKEETGETKKEPTVDVFQNTEAFRIVKPVEAEILKPYSDAKPVKSKTMGDWRVHNGVDIRAAQGTEVKAPADGKITRAEEDGLTGYTISIDHGNHIISTIYNLEKAEKVSVGQEVKKGDVIGTAGNTAKTEMLDDAHIHYELQMDGKYVNPESYLK